MERNKMKLSPIAAIVICVIVISSFSGIEFSRSATTTTYTISSSGTITAAPTGTVYWRTGFETGTYSEISSGGVAQLASAPYAKLSIVTSPVFKGTYASRADVVSKPSSGIVRAKAIRWDPIRNLPQAYFGAALYLPSNFDVSTSANWVNIMQLHVMSDSASGLPACIIMTKSNGVLKMNLYQKTVGGSEIYHWSGPAIVGQWFTVVIYCHFVQNGHCSLWVNGNLVFDQAGDYRTGDPNYVGAFCDTGIYEDYRSPVQYVVSDEMIIASTLAAATPVR
jgi:hypothetical protein